MFTVLGPDAGIGTEVSGTEIWQLDRMCAFARQRGAMHPFRRSDILTQIAGIASRPSHRILLCGDPGMGKSSILREAAAAFDNDGFRVLAVNPGYAERRIPYNALWDLLSTVDWENTPLHEEYRVFLRVVLGAGVPREALSPLSVSVAVEALLAHLAADAPVVIAIDDDQWVDPESKLVLHRAWRRSRHLPVYFVTTRRRSPATDDSPADELDTTDSIELSGLSVRELDELAHTILGTSLTTRQLTALHAHTAGNPMWARELIVGGFVAELEALPVGTVGAPATLRESVDARLGELSHTAINVVSVVALIGHSTAEQLVAVLELDGTPNDALAEAENAGFLAIATDEIRVAHPLHASSAVARLTPSRRRQLHAAIARTERSVELHARHLHLSEPPGVFAALASMLDRAADCAGRRGAPIKAAHFAAQAAARSEPGSTGQQRRLLTQAQQLCLAGDYAGAADILGRIDPLRFDATRFDVCVALTTTCVEGGAGAARQHLETLAARMPPDRHRAAIIAAFSEDDSLPIDKQLRLAREVLEVLDPEVTPLSARRAAGTVLRSEVDLGLGLNAESMRGEVEALEHADGPLSETAYAQRAFLAKDLDDIQSSRKALAELINRSDSRGEEGAASLFRVHAAAAETLAEDYAAARAHLNAAGFPFPQGLLRPIVLATHGQLMIASADWTGLEDMLTAHVNAHSGSAVFRDLYTHGLRGLSARAREEWPVAVEHLRSAATIADDRGLVELGRRFRVDLPLIEALFHCGEIDEARTRLAGVRTVLTSVERPISQTWLHRANALDLAADGDIDRAIIEVTTSADLARAAGRRADESLALLYRVRLSRRRRRLCPTGNDLERARNLAAAAGNHSLRSLIDGTASTLRPERPDAPLTPAEQRVFALVRVGETNREISARLFVSVRTVESHVASILRKTGAGSRLKLLAHE